MSGKKPIIKWGFWKYKESWFRLSVEERQKRTDGLLAKYKELGIKVLVSARALMWVFDHNGALQKSRKSEIINL